MRGCSRPKEWQLVTSDASPLHCTDCEPGKRPELPGNPGPPARIAWHRGLPFLVATTMRFLLCLGVFASLCPAQLLEVGVHGGQHRFSRAALGSSSSRPGAPNEYSLDGGFRLGFRMTTNSDTHWGHEFGYAYN
ncbi:MAG: hypothetical protein ACK56I_33845, partial [bacterium]